jgi:hypothetical protein
MAYPTGEQTPVGARRFWQEAGKAEGPEHDFWHRAERQLQQQKNQPNLSDNSLSTPRERPKPGAAIEARPGN